MREQDERRKIELQEMRECSFTPTINPHQESQGTGIYTDFYTRQLRFSSEAGTRIELTRAEFERQAVREMQPAPAICPKSDRLFARLKSREGGPSRAYQRLYVHSQNRQLQEQEQQLAQQKGKQNQKSKQEPKRKASAAPHPDIYRAKSPTMPGPDLTFHPLISPRAKGLRRNASVETMLYYDAVRRTRASESIKLEEDKKYVNGANSAKALAVSDAWVTRRFEQKFASAWTNILKGADSVECVGSLSKQTQYCESVR